MVLPISEVRRIVERVCARQDVLDACAERDLGCVIGIFQENGLTQSQMAGLTGLYQVQLSNWKTGKHRPKDISVFAAFADGLGLPPAARRALGLDTSPPEAAGIGVPQATWPPRDPCSFWRAGNPVMAQCMLGRPAMGSDSTLLRSDHQGLAWAYGMGVAPPRG